MNVSEQRAALENECRQLYDLAQRLVARADRLAAKAQLWEFKKTSDEVRTFATAVDRAARERVSG